MKATITLALAAALALTGCMTRMEPGGGGGEPGRSEGGRQGNTEPDPSQVAPAGGGGGGHAPSAGGRQGNPHSGGTKG